MMGPLFAGRPIHINSVPDEYLDKIRERPLGNLAATKTFTSGVSSMAEAQVVQVKKGEDTDETEDVLQLSTWDDIPADSEEEKTLLLALMDRIVDGGYLPQPFADQLREHIRENGSS